MQVPELFEMKVSSPVGNLRLIADDEALVAICWYDDCKTPYALHVYNHSDQHNILVQAKDELAQYFNHERQSFDVPTKFLFGTDFQKQVWRALCGIALGQTTSYGALATDIDRPKAVRAVATAIAHNPLSIIVPCHRVVGKQGDLRGFAGGLKNKQYLLDLEQV
ncbi:methylated-DNA--[protein]-cysteine S-methyltransferase [Acinetobacter boissieri]|uniref:Methylated-DNA--protein-cysteine methyltransferase n=1 Tax=Acinetobacter boissieri TaxID=1219383 RepID=A0A1G6J6F1_9GAMM|nr:methylated-DNA--[protein]-cysteine S-methyltransferase [Acinetobacter boissieri]SDC13905.1 methylated-DNA-[protein]-cysteine S-methyltransferase [Acinetobacter boissieri]